MESYFLKKKEIILFFLIAIILSPICSCKKKVEFPVSKSPKIEKSKIYAESYLTKTRAYVGERVRLYLNVWHPEEVNLDVTDKIYEMKGMEIIDVGEFNKITLEGIERTTKWYDLKANAEGIYIIPSFTISYELGGKFNVLDTGQLYIEITNKEGGFIPTESIRGIKPPYKPKVSTNYLGAAVISLFMILSLFLLIFYFKPFKKEEFNLAEEEIVYAHKIALSEFNRIKKDLEEKNISAKEFCFELSSILKNYIVERWEMETVQMTSYELMGKLKKLEKIDTNHLKKAYHIISVIELMKFASMNLKSEWIKDIEREFLEFIDETKQMSPEDIGVTAEI